MVPIAPCIIESETAENLWQAIIEKHPVDLWSDQVAYTAVIHTIYYIYYMRTIPYSVTVQFGLIPAFNFSSGYIQFNST